MKIVWLVKAIAVVAMFCIALPHPVSGGGFFSKSSTTIKPRFFKIGSKNYPEEDIVGFRNCLCSFKNEDPKLFKKLVYWFLHIDIYDLYREFFLINKPLWDANEAEILESFGIIEQGENFVLLNSYVLICALTRIRNSNAEIKELSEIPFTAD